MWTRISLCLLLIVVTESIVAEDAVIENLPGRFLSIEVSDQTGKKDKTLAAISIQIPETGEFACISGGETQSKRFIGTRVKGDILAREDQNVKLEILIETASRVRADDPQTDVMTSEKIVLSTRLKIGEQKVIPVSANRRCRLRIE